MFMLRRPELGLQNCGRCRQVVVTSGLTAHNTFVGFRDNDQYVEICQKNAVLFFKENCKNAKSNVISTRNTFQKNSKEINKTKSDSQKRNMYLKELNFRSEQLLSFI